jgi:hypothetical protein
MMASTGVTECSRETPSAPARAILTVQAYPIERGRYDELLGMLETGPAHRETHEAKAARPASSTETPLRTGTARR